MSCGRPGPSQEHQELDQYVGEGPETDPGPFAKAQPAEAIFPSKPVPAAEKDDNNTMQKMRGQICSKSKLARICMLWKLKYKNFNTFFYLLYNLFVVPASFYRVYPPPQMDTAYTLT